MWMTTTKIWVYYTEKVMRPPHIFSSSSENKIRSIKIDDHMNNSISNSGSVSFCIQKCVIYLTRVSIDKDPDLTQTKHE